jgi:hypothetical protein
VTLNRRQLLPCILICLWQLPGSVAARQIPTGSVSGTVTTDEGSPPPFSAAVVRVVTIPAQAPAKMSARAEVPVTSGWLFQFPSIAEAVYFRLTGLPDEWRLAAVRVGGQDFTDTAFVPSGSGGVQIVVTRESATLAGDVVDPHGAPAPGTFVLLFAEDGRRWGPASRFVTSVRADGEGNFAVRGLPPATYLASVAEAAPEGWDRPDALQNLKASAVKLTLPVGVTTISLRIEH